MKNFSFAKAFTLGTLLCLSLPVACGDDDDSTPNNTAGTSNTGGEPAGDAGAAAGGAATVMLPPGISDAASTKMCGADTCQSAKIVPAPLYVNPCCDATDGCGLDTGFFSLVGAQFKDSCQSHDQAGDPSDACAAVSGLKVPFDMGGTTVMVPLDAFPGCCRPDNKCGVVIDNVTSGSGKIPIANMGLGCVDAAAFGKAAACSPGAGGAGGAGGTSGGESGGADAGGAPAAAGGAGGAGGAK